MRGLRFLGRAPGFALAAVLTLALGIGANVACFSIVRAVLLKPLGYRDPDRLVLLSGGATPTHFAQIQSSARNYSAVGAHDLEQDLAFTGRGMPEVVKTIRVTSNFLKILGVSPLLGNGFGTSDNTVLIGFDFWQRTFHGDAHVVGQTINLGGIAYTILGVLRAGFAFPSAGIDVWLSHPQDSPAFSPQSRALSPFLTIFGRLSPGVTLDQATAELKVMQTSYARAHPAMLDAKPKSPTAAMPLQQNIVRQVQPELWLLFGATFVVLLIACANLAGLLLARAVARSTEFAVRSALGASRARIVKELILETLVLSSLGGVAGAFLACLCLAIVRRIAGTHLPRASEIQFDFPVAAFAIVLSLVAAILFGLAPSLSASRADLMALLRTSQANSGRVRSRGFLVATQIAFSVVLLISAVLLLESILRLKGEALGFESQNLLTARIALPPDANPSRFFDDLLTRISSSPGVEHASVSLTLPMTSYPGTPVQDASQPPLPLNQRPLSALFIVSPDYFRTLRIPLRRGRIFTARDDERARRVAVIDERLARYLWPDYPSGQNPIGREILIGGVNKAPAEIIGVVADVHQNIEDAGWGRSVYVPFAQLPVPSAMLAVRVSDNPLRFGPTLRRTIQSLNPDQPLSELQAMQELVDDQLGSRRLLLEILGFFASVALSLAVLGIYGLVSYSVNQRTREMGVRRALGASRISIIELILVQTLRWTLAGIVIGAVAAIAVTKFLRSYLFHIDPTDPITFVAVFVLFIIVAIAAALRPAFRAAQIDAMQALRYQ
ncbi:MAG TPA: ABC transporter permease [Bryobacteraceae bacterium]|jgi:predicted permease|nr:ABC transporter permease [Bryobacteraceae bacterium]